MPDENDHRRRILEKAGEKFFTLGYSRVTMDEIANDLGMSKKTLYKYFPAKGDLLQTVALEFIRGVIAEQDRILHDEAFDFEQRVSELMKLLARIVGRISPSFLRDVQRTAPTVWKTIEETRHRRIHTVFGGLLDEGQRKGFVREDVHLPFVVFFIAATIRETLNPSVLSQFPVSLMEAFETLRSVFMGGMLTDLGRRKFLDETAFSGPNETIRRQ